MTDRVRTTISLDPEVLALFTRMADVARVSVSRCMGDWLADTAEGAQFVLQKMDDARKSPMIVMREFQALSVGLHDEIEKTMEQVRHATRPPASGVAGRTGKAAGRGSNSIFAPSSLTGLKSPRKSHKTLSKASPKVAK